MIGPIGETFRMGVRLVRRHSYIHHMSRQGIIRRYAILLDVLSSRAYPCLSDFRRRYESVGFQLSDRSLKRDIEQLRDEFGVEIVYHRSRGGYAIDADLSLDVDAFLRVLELGVTTDLLVQSLSEGRETLRYVDVEVSSDMRGIDHLSVLLQAIREKQVVRFEYGFFGEREPEAYTLHPYLLKEFQRRWYVVGLAEGRQGFRTFGLDRIHDLQRTDRSFVRDAALDPKSSFRHVYGLNYAGSPVPIRISCTRTEASYLDALPIHASQVRLGESDTHVEFGFHLVPNHEFRQRLLMMTGAMTILEPASLRDSYVEQLRSGLGRHGLA